MLVHTQAWMESGRSLQKLLPVSPDTPVQVLQLRRNFKFRKLIVQAGDERFVVYKHYLPRGIRNLAWFCEQARHTGVQVPKPLARNLQWTGFIRHEGFGLVLPYVEGDPLNNHTPVSTLVVLGQKLAGLHSITGHRWGQLMTNFASRGSYWSGLQKFWKKAVQQMCSHAGFAANSDMDKIMDWLTGHGVFLGNTDSFSLTHGDPASGNLLKTPDGGLCLIDCDRIGFEPAGMELGNTLLQSYCAGNPQRQTTLVSAYLQACPDNVRQQWEQHAQFFIAAALLWRTQRKLQWGIKRSDTGSSLQRAEYSLKQLQELIETQPAAWQEAVQSLHS